MSLISYAESELNRLGGQDDEMQKLMNQNILDIVKMFADQGHSGFSAGYALNLLDRLLRYKPITPLTGEDDEWEEVSSHGVKQNKRCSSVFIQEDGTVTDNDAIVVSDNGGITWFSSNKFKKRVEFPYYPPTYPEERYIEYTEDVPPGFTGDEWIDITNDKERIQKLYEKKRKEFDEVEVE